MAYFNFSEIDNTTAEPELKSCSGNLSDYDWSDFTPRRFLEECRSGRMRRKFVPVKRCRAL